MSLRTKSCANDPNNFCYICGSFVAKAQPQNVTKFVQKEYYAYLEQNWVTRTKHGLHIKFVVVVLNHCFDGAMESKKVWHLSSPWCEESQRHIEINAISAVAMFLDSMQKKHHIPYPNLPSAIRPVPHGPDVPVPASPAICDHRPTLFGQEELNDVVRDLDLPELSALLGSSLKSKNLLNDGGRFSWYKHREKKYLPFFINEIHWFIVSMSKG